MNTRVAINKKTINDVPIDDQVVLVRSDYNVPLAKDGTIDNDYRIRMSLPTIKELKSRKARVVIVSHLGRPDGQVNAKFTLEPVSARLSKLLGSEVKFISDCIGDKVSVAVKKMRPGEVILLENLRYYPGEEANDSDFAKKLAKSSGARYFVQDGFGVVHRAHASTSAITEQLPSVSGLLLKREFETISSVMANPERPLVAVLGGAKITDKISVVNKFVTLADHIIIGGAMANTFLKYKGNNIGKSLSEDGLDSTLDQIHQSLGEHTDKLVLPSDVAVGKSVDPSEPRRDVSLEDVASDDLILDIGVNSIERAVEIISSAKTVVWSGTLGLAEHDQFAHGSARVALTLATNPQITSVVGGGDTTDFVLGWDAKNGDSFTDVSTGGSASLELMAGDKLPGIEALLDA